jgi:hypothetical protein
MSELNRIPIQFSDTNYHPRSSVSICGENVLFLEMSAMPATSSGSDLSYEPSEN